MTDSSPKTVKARLVPLGAGKAKAVDVHFNPASLVYTVENSTKQQSGDPKRKQFAAQFTGKLTMDLQFDTTGTGADVRITTNQVALLMQASANAGKNPASDNAQAPPVVSFQWGSYEFKGTIDSFKETIDFFSADGVPLRSLVSISMARQDQVLDVGAGLKSTKVNGTLASAAAGPSLVPTPKPGNVTSVATMGGDPSAARQLAADNGLESLRSTGGVALEVNAGIQLNAAVGFSAAASVSAGAGLSIGGGTGLSIGAGAGLSLGAGASLGGSGGVAFGAGAGIAASSTLQVSAGLNGGALFGGQASARVPATAGAFAGLEIGRASKSTTTRLDPLRMLPSTTSADVSTGENASFSLGGAASVSAGFSSDVGASFDYRDQLVFDGN